MRHVKKIKKAPEDEVVAEQAVPQVLATNDALKGYLQLGKHLLKKGDNGVVYVRPVALYSAQSSADCKKLFLRKDKSYYPPLKKLQKWVADINEQPRIINEHTGCVITLAQPRCSRPVRTFRAWQDDGTWRADGITFGSLVLRASGICSGAGWFDASHRCGYSRCVAVDHLVWESPADNVARNECHHYGAVCRHQPRCLTPFDYEFAQLIKEELTRQ